MSIGSWRQPVVRPKRRRRGPPPGYPIPPMTEDQQAQFQKNAEDILVFNKAAAGNLPDGEDKNKITSAMDAQEAARKKSGQTATVKE